MKIVGMVNRIFKRLRANFEIYISKWMFKWKGSFFLFLGHESCVDIDVGLDLRV